MSVFKRRDRTVSIRLSEEEYKELLKLCSVEHARSISDLGRRALNRLNASACAAAQASRFPMTDLSCDKLSGTDGEPPRRVEGPATVAAAFQRGVDVPRTTFALGRGAPGDLPAIAGGRPIRHPRRRLTVSSPCIEDAEFFEVAKCLASGWIGPGGRVEQFEREFAHYKNAPYAAAVSSGTAAIHLALLALGVGPGDEVIAPTMTFCSTVHSIIHAGAVPVLVDCCRDTFNVNPEDVERSISSKTKAIVVTHMCGRCCEMSAILDIARKHDLRVIEDSAHAIEATYQGKPAGLLGDVGCFSFYATKNVTTADGGMMITFDRHVAAHVRLLSRQGIIGDAWTRFRRSWRGYKVVAAGFKYNMTDLSASLGLAQLSKIEQRWRQREAIWRMYDRDLQDLPLTLPPPPEAGTRHAYHLYTPLLQLGRLGVSRAAIMTALAAENIVAGVHFVPLHQQPYYRRNFGLRLIDYPNATYVGQRTISLPLFPELTSEDVADVCRALRRILLYYASHSKSAGSR